MPKCGDCLYYCPGGHRDSYCNKTRNKTDSDNSACRSFLSEKHSSCYDCDHFRYSNNFCTARFRTVNEPISYYCDRFRPDD